MDPPQPAQIGGRLLGAGVYGCTFEPAPRCAGGKVFKKVHGLPAVGKVTSEDPTEEVAVGRAIMALPKAADYFALPTETCTPALPIDDSDVKRCEFLKEPGTDISLMIMPMGGASIIKWGANLRALYESYERVFIHLLEGMLIYQRAGYVHNDIHMANIVVDDAGTARYIDFGLAYKPAAVKTWSDSGIGLSFKPKYVMQPPEIHAWRALFDGISLSRGLQQLKEINQEYSQLERDFLARPSMETAMEDLREEMTRLIADNKGNRQVAGGAFLRQNGTKSDSWRLGLVMWFLWKDLMQGIHGFKATTLYRRRGQSIRQALSGLTDFNYNRRFTAERALEVLRRTAPPP